MSTAELQGPFEAIERPESDPYDEEQHTEMGSRHDSGQKEEQRAPAEQRQTGAAPAVARRSERDAEAAGVVEEQLQGQAEETPPRRRSLLEAARSLRARVSWLHGTWTGGGACCMLHGTCCMLSPATHPFVPLHAQLPSNKTPAGALSGSWRQREPPSPGPAQPPSPNAIAAPRNQGAADHGDPPHHAQDDPADADRGGGGPGRLLPPPIPSASPPPISPSSKHAAAPAPRPPITVAERLKAARAAAGPPPPSIGATISRAKAALAKARGSPAAATSASADELAAQRSAVAVGEKLFSVFGSKEIKPKAPVSECGLWCWVDTAEVQRRNKGSATNTPDPAAKHRPGRHLGAQRRGAGAAAPAVPAGGGAEGAAVGSGASVGRRVHPCMHAC
jgi:hypothetical protein